MRRKRTVKPIKHRSVGVVMFFVLSAIAAIALVAAEWRQSVTGVVLEVRGGRLTSEAAIAEAVGITDSTNLDGLDLFEVRQRILENPYIREVSLVRDPPQTLIVDISERTPIAILLNIQAEDWLIDEDGFVLPTIQLPEVYDVPVITGASDIPVLKPGVRIVNKKVQQALQVLKTARSMSGDVLYLLSEINVAPKHDLILYTLEAGVPVLFGSVQNAENKLRSFNAFWENVARKYDPATLEYVDLRWKNQIVTRWSGTSPYPLQPADVSDSTAITDTLFIKE